MLTSAPAAIASMNSLVPDLAMVPKLFTNSFGHSNSTINDGQGVVGLVGNDVNEKLGLCI
ncbi:hypothetical protein Hdeb2414_s0001g00015961 [Helianthus debilis subsp. tardiflorus]